MLRRSMSSRSLKGFTLVELLVVIGIIALLISILMPALSGAREMAKSTQSLSNIRQLGIALLGYKADFKGYYPNFSLEGSSPKLRWADFIYPYLKNTAVFVSPMLTESEKERMLAPFAHTCNPDGTTNDNTIYHGGYGYNYQYLGNGRTVGGTLQPYHANDSIISNSSQTIAIADSNGSKDGGTTWTKHGVYAIDPPLGSVNLGSKGSRKNSAVPGANNSYYRSSNDEAGPDFKFRATPAERNRGNVNVLFCDGHGEPMKLQEMDDFNGDGINDNGYWNGKADPNLK